MELGLVMSQDFGVLIWGKKWKIILSLLDLILIKGTYLY